MSARRCRVCGCTQNRACPGRCWWVAADLCSSCVRTNATEVWEYGNAKGEDSRSRSYTCAACPHCGGCEATAMPDGDDDEMSVVACPCGHYGPSRASELEALQAWNNWNGTPTEPIGDWKVHPYVEHDDSAADLPF